MPKLTPFVQKFRELRRSGRLNLDDVSSKLGIPMKDLTALDKGEHIPSDRDLERFGELVGASPDDLADLLEKAKDEDAKAYNDLPPRVRAFADRIAKMKAGYR